MKNKTLQRVLCFCLALCFCFSIAIEPIQAHAVALELGWVTWALVSYLAASGFAFAVTGGIEALQSEVEQQVDEYYTVTGIDLFQLIAQSLKMRPPNGGGLGNGFWFGAAAVAAIADFIDWVRNNKWFAGEETDSALNMNTLKVSVDGVLKDFKLSSPNSLDGDSFTLAQLESGNVIFYQQDGTAVSFRRYNSGSKYDLGVYLNGSYASRTYPISVIRDGRYTLEDFPLIYVQTPQKDYELGYVNLLFQDTKYTGSQVRIVELFEFYGYMPTRYFDYNSLNSSSTITSPTEVTEFDVQENQYVEIDFSVFENETTFEEPEQLAEAIKNQLVDTGAVPTISTEIKTEPTPTPQPTPAPTPVVPLPENPTYDDIDGLGLPTLGDALLDKFPFCLPSDFGRVIGIFKVERQTPVWEVDLYEMLGDRIPFAGDTALSIDLTEYEELGAISRWVTTIGFCLFLLLITRQMITW